MRRGLHHVAVELWRWAAWRRRVWTCAHPADQVRTVMYDIRPYDAALCHACNSLIPQSRVQWPKERQAGA
jgi:hypothetical protein